MLNALDKIKSCIFHDDPVVFIIGGGSSLFSYLKTPQMLSGRNVITTNNAYRLFPEAMCAHFADMTWYNWHTTEEFNVHRDFKNVLTTASNVQRKLYNPELVHVFSKGVGTGISLDKHSVNGENAGHQALNIAVHLGFKEIVLLGYDLTMTRKTHWHDDHKRQTDVSRYASVMIPGFVSTVPVLNKQEITVWNANKDSALKCFPHKCLKEFL